MNDLTKIAEYLLKCEAVKLSPDQPFTWTSGLRSPIYCDNRVTLSYPEIRKFITQSLVVAIQSHFPDCDAIAGVATAGIAQGALIADNLNVPFAYVRPEPKKHGLKNSIEGRLSLDSKIVVVEDLISTGKSSLKAVEDLRESGHQVLGLVSIFNYGFDDTKTIFKEKNCEYLSLCHFKTLAEVASKENYISQEQLDKILKWNEDPKGWSDSMNSNF